MKRLLKTALLLVPGLLLAQPVFPPAYWARAPAVAGSTSLVHQDFEGTGYDNGETWTEAGTCTIDEDNVAVVIDGSQSLDLNTSANACSTFVSFTGQTTLYTAFKIRHASGAAVAAAPAIIRNGTTILATISIRSGNILNVLAAGGTINASSDAMPTDTTTDIWIWFEYVAGSGSDAIARAGWSTDGTKPTLSAGGAKSCASSNGTATTTADRLYLGPSGSATMRIIYDRVRVSSAVIGSNFN